MKKKNWKLFLILGLVLFLSVGYAVVNSITLSITGSAGAGSEEINTFFTGATEISKTASATVTPTVTAESKTASLAISNMTLNETVTVKYKIANEETDVGALISVGSITNSNPTYFDVTASVQFSSVMCASSSQSNDYNYLILTVKLKKTPIASADSETTIDVSINATASTAPSGCPS